MEQEDSIPKLDEAYYFRQLQAHQIENIIINLTKQEENDTLRLQSLILSHYAIITQSFDLLKQIHKDADELSQTILTSFTEKQEQLNTSTMHEQSTLFEDLDQSLALFDNQQCSTISRIYQNAFDDAKFDQAIKLIEDRLDDPQMCKLIMDSIVSKIRKDFKYSEDTKISAYLLEKAYSVINEKMKENTFAEEVVSQFMRPLLDELTEVEGIKQESEKEGLLSDLKEQFQQFKQYVHFSGELTRIEQLLRNLSFAREQLIESYYDEINGKIEKQMQRILEEEFNSLQNNEVLLEILSAATTSKSVKQLIENHLHGQVNAQLQLRIETLNSFGKQELNFKTIHELKRTILELEQFLIFDCEPLTHFLFFKEMIHSLKMKKETIIQRILWRKVQETSLRAIGMKQEEEKNIIEGETSEESIRLINLLNFY